ncbi:MAG: O-antigen ligase family protein [Candidatus Roizmanbacteria bacterium]|nr:O-antigen ligase family protein [Candidatus Roizmanbacteria bacterium]
MSNTTLQKQLVFWGLSLLLVTPLLVASFLFFPFITGKNFFFRIVVEIITALWLSKCLVDTSWRPRKGILLASLSGLLLIVLLSTIFSVDPYRSFWSNFERMEGAITYIHLFLLFLIATSVFTRTKDWWRFWAMSTGVSLVVSGMAFMQIFGLYAVHQGSTRLDATLGNASYLAVYMLFSIFITGLLWLQSNNHNARRYGYPLITIIQIFVLYKTGTRGAILGLIFGVCIASLFFLIRGKAYVRARRYALGALAGVVLITGALFVARNTSFIQTSPVLSRFASISLSDRTVTSRLTIWKMSWEGFTERPVFGWGLENFGAVFNKYYEPELWRQEPWFDRSHNVFLDWLTLTGVVGFIFYVGLYCSSLYLLWRRSSTFEVKERVLLTALIAAYLFQNLFIFDNIVSLILFISLLAYIHVRSSENSEFLFATASLGRLRWVGSTAIILLLGSSLYFINLQPLIASVELIQGLQPQEKGLTENLKAFQSVFSRHTFAVGEASEQLIQFTQGLVSDTQATQELKQETVTFATKTLQEQIARTPYDARLRLFYGSFLQSLNQTNVAEKYLKEALVLAPRKQQILFQLGSLYLESGRKEEALAMEKQAFDLDQSFPEARKIYALTAFLTGHKDITQSLLVPVYGSIAVPDSRFAAFYTREGNFPLAIQSLEAMEKDPEITLEDRDRLLLSSLYVRAGRRDDAIAQVEFLKKNSPGLIPNADALIAEIRAGRDPYRMQISQ